MWNYLPIECIKNPVSSGYYLERTGWEWLWDDDVVKLEFRGPVGDFFGDGARLVEDLENSFNKLRGLSKWKS